VSPAQIIDACVLINLLATGELKNILDSVGRDSLICAVVQKESIYLKTNDPNSPKELIDLTPFLNDRTISVCEIQGHDEELLYVDLASVLDDGEAMTLAIAINRKLFVVTDERKARRLFLEQTADPKYLISTSDIIRHWARNKRISASKLRDVLRNVEARASYRPPQIDRNQKWWLDAVR
jgi:predicted nucleic acid-binding protein